jgi:hypothetical protein
MWKDKSVASKIAGMIMSFVGGVVIGAIGETLDEEYEVEIKDREKKDSSGLDEPSINQEAEEYSRNYINDMISNAMKKANSTPNTTFGT